MCAVCASIEAYGRIVSEAADVGAHQRNAEELEVQYTANRVIHVLWHR